jgi:hypothetical protein
MLFESINVMFKEAGDFEVMRFALTGDSAAMDQHKVPKVVRANNPRSKKIMVILICLFISGFFSVISCIICFFWS